MEQMKIPVRHGRMGIYVFCGWLTGGVCQMHSLVAIVWILYNPIFDTL